MKLKEFLKQFEGLDPEIEVGINNQGCLDKFADLNIMYVDKKWIEYPFGWYPKLESNKIDENFVEVAVLGYE